MSIKLILIQQVSQKTIMKKIQQLSLLIVIVILITACGSPQVGSVADMSDYEGLDDKETQVFIVSDVKDFLQRLDNKETFVAYFGFANCPWCNDAISVLNAEAKKKQINIYYINTRPNRWVKANSGIPDYDLLLKKVGQFLGKNEEGNAYLYVPFVFFIKDGDVIFAHQGTVDGYEPEFIPFSDELKEQLKEKYLQGFSLLS